MSAIKRLIEDVMELYEQGEPMLKIAKELDMSIDEVETIVEEYSNFYD
jgi:orotate phosphoribosyltransferase-like protein